MKKIIVFFAFVFSTLQSYSQDYIEKSYWNERLEWQSHKLLSSRDRGYFILAHSNYYGEHDIKDDHLLKLDSSGNELWHYEVGVGQNGLGYAYSDFSVSSDSFVYFACNEMGCSGDGNVYKIDYSGNVVWDRLYGLNIFAPGSKFYAICSASNNDQVVGGAITSC